MSGSRPLALLIACGLLILRAVPSPAQPATRLVAPPGATLADLRARFDPAQLALLEKLNRRDLDHLADAPRLLVPEVWNFDERAFSPLSDTDEWAVPFAKAIVVDLARQAFAAYEHGRLVRWGPVSSGNRAVPTPAGPYHLTWRSPGRHSTVNPDWFMRWYFNFENRRGLSFHAYVLPGGPASHACVRLLDRDARWLFDWGQEWQLDERGQSVVRPGTPVDIRGCYDHQAPPPWLSSNPSGGETSAGVGSTGAKEE